MILADDLFETFRAPAVDRGHCPVPLVRAGRFLVTADDRAAGFRGKAIAGDLGRDWAVPARHAGGRPAQSALRTPVPTLERWRHEAPLDPPAGGRVDRRQRPRRLAVSPRYPAVEG